MKFVCRYTIYINMSVTPWPCQYKPTSNIVEIISESIHAMVYAYRIPTLLELNPIGLYLLFVQQVFYVYCQCHIIINVSSTNLE